MSKLFNKQELIMLIHASGNVETVAAAERIVSVMLYGISQAVVQGQKVSLAGFGIFSKKGVKARVGRNPKTGAAVKIKPHSKVKFTPALAFKKAVNVKAT